MSDLTRKGGNPALKPGVTSLNPAGRPPRGQSLAEQVRRRVDPDELIDALLGIAADPKTRAADRLMAISQLFDRGWGRPLATTQSLSVRVQGTLQDFDPATWDQLPASEKKRILAEVTKR